MSEVKRGSGAGAPTGAGEGDDREARRAGLCGRCTHARRVTSGKGSTFWMCQAPGLMKYPPLPVMRCASFQPAT